MSKFIATIERSPSGQVYMVNPYGGPFDMSKHVGKHLYTSDEIERKDAAIAELVEALKVAKAELVDLNNTIRWRDGEWPSVTAINAALAKHAISKAPS